MNDLNANADKLAFQTYEMQHGIEKLKIMVPLKNAKMFESDFANLSHKSKDALMELLVHHSGKMRD